jgi:hypothetical protein
MKDFKPWEKRPGVLPAMMAREEREPFEVRAERYRENVEKVLATRELIARVKGFVTGCGGIDRVTEQKCIDFVRDNRKLVDQVGNTDDPAYVYALVHGLHSIPMTGK